MRKKSKYKPKGVRLDTMAWVQSGMKVVASLPEAGVLLRIKNHDALTSLTQGTGTRDNIDILVAAMNVSEALAMLGVGEDWREEIKVAQDAIFTMGRRGLSKGRFLFTGPEMQAMNLGMDIHDAQLENCTVKQLEEALGIVEREIRHHRARSIKDETLCTV